MDINLPRGTVGVRHCLRPPRRGCCYGDRREGGDGGSKVSRPMPLHLPRRHRFLRYLRSLFKVSAVRVECFTHGWLLDCDGVDASASAEAPPGPTPGGCGAGRGESPRPLRLARPAPRRGPAARCDGVGERAVVARPKPLPGECRHPRAVMSRVIGAAGVGVNRPRALCDGACDSPERRRARHLAAPSPCCPHASLRRRPAARTRRSGPASPAWPAST